MITCPKRVVYVFSYTKFLDRLYDNTLNKWVDTGEEVTPFSCCDETRPDTIKTAEREFSSYVNTGKLPVQKIDMDNVPKTGYRISKVGHHNNRDYYYVITPEGFFADIHLDDLKDIMDNDGVVKGEILSPLIWVRERKTKLVRFNSEIHKEAVKNGKAE